MNLWIPVTRPNETRLVIELILVSDVSESGITSDSIDFLSRLFVFVEVVIVHSNWISNHQVFVVRVEFCNENRDFEESFC